MEIYVVQSGDTFYAIAQRYGLTTAQLQAANEIPDPAKLAVGQALLIPTPTAVALSYTVRSGDTLYQLAQLFGTTVSAIAQANSISNPAQIAVGQVLTIPGWSQSQYTVRSGDTLYQIASRYNTTASLIARVNGIANPALIYPGQVLTIPQPGPAAVTPTSIESIAYFQISGISRLEQSVAQLGQYFTYGALFHYPVSATGTLTISANTQRAVTALWNQNVKPLAVITNWGATGTFESELARTIMSDAAVKSQTIANTLALLNSYQFAGVNVDFENMYPEDRPLYNSFISDLAAALRPRGFTVSLAVAPKAADLPNASWVGAFDYATLGALVDLVFIMTYEWGWVGGPPMAISPINQVRRVLTYAVSQIPAAKVMQGVPLYGYDWPIPQTPERLAATVDLVNVYTLATDYNAAIQYDTTSQAPWFRYTDTGGQQHEVWFDDARSVTVKYQTAQEFGLRGVGFWSPINQPYGFTANWLIFDERFNVSK
jgi:spore germination protein